MAGLPRAGPMASFLGVFVALDGLSFATAQVVLGGDLEKHSFDTAVFAPNSPYHVKVAVGEAKFVSYSCMGGPADAVITLTSYAEQADPLLFLSLSPVEPPTFQKHDGSNFGQWREDDAGDHYVIAKGVSPEGGILGLVNVKPFAREELNGILSIQCTYIIAFDGLFWDHLRSEEVCPIGGNYQVGGVLDPTRFCSGHGECMDHGICECSGDRTGAACEHKKDDIVTAAEGRYRFSLDTGHYQYFRIRVPNEFPGGFLEVQTWGERPLVVLVRGDSLPTKSNFELSNFDDWISGRNISVLRYKVPAFSSGTFAQEREDETLYKGQKEKAHTSYNVPRRMQEDPRDQEMDQLDAPWQHATPLQGQQVQCPDMGFRTHVPGCKTETLRACQDSCRLCTQCVKGRDGPECSRACEGCTDRVCTKALALCAGELSCQGREATYCKRKCGGCMACLDSNDRDCKNCGCCLDCLPMAAKCGSLAKKPETRYVFVGVYSHRRYFNDVSTVNALADVVLKLDPKFAQTEVPSSWLASLYDPFHDLTHLKHGDREVYPEGEQYIYELTPVAGKMVHEQVRVFRDRMTLLHIPNEDAADRLMLQLSGSNVTHVLVSTRAAPKTLFDFNGAPNVRPGRAVEIMAGGEKALWCAIFGGSDGWASVEAAKLQDPSGTTVPLNFVLFCIVGIVMMLAGVGCVFGASPMSGSLGEACGADAAVPLSQRLWCFVTRQTEPHESTAGLTREDTMTGFASSDVIDRNVEDQFLQRGGMGDDGI